MVKFNKSAVFSLLLFMIIILAGCAVIKPERIIYNPDTGLYEYPAGASNEIFLRNHEGHLVSRSNFQDFMIGLAKNNYRYPFEIYTEQDGFLKESDLQLAKLYSQAAQEISDSNFMNAIGHLAKLHDKYPAAAWYSDMAFLQGYALELSGNSVAAALRYNDFLTYSSGKYSGRFRGYAFSDPHNVIWSRQRDYAHNYLADKPADPAGGFFNPIVPQYYSSSFLPGYGLNDEDLALNPRGQLFLTLGGVIANGFGIGVQYYRSLNQTFDINPGFFWSKNRWVANVAVPVQLYKSANNRFGLKLSPFASYVRYSEVAWNNTQWQTNEGVFNAGAKISAGYYIMQRLSVGAWYTWYYYNSSNPYTFNSQPLSIWWENEYDFSLYLNLFKRFSLKGGIRTGNPVAGFFWNGTEISFDFTTQEIIWRSDLY